MTITKEDLDKVLNNLPEDTMDAAVQQTRMRQAQVPIIIEDFNSVISSEFNLHEFNRTEPQFNQALEDWCQALNYLREKYLATNDYRYWSLFWDLVPVGYVYEN